MAEPVLRWPGSKWRLAGWIISHFPPHDVYLEPFFGSGAVFFNKVPADTETINDLDGHVVNLFRVIRERPEELAALVEMTPWARHEYMMRTNKAYREFFEAKQQAEEHFCPLCGQSMPKRQKNEFHPMFSEDKPLPVKSRPKRGE